MIQKTFLLFLLTLLQVNSAEKPNILFCIADDAAFKYMGAYGCDWVKTPAFDRMADEGLLFMKAYTPNAKCAPSRASVLTGRNSWQLEAAGNHNIYFPAKFKVFTETLQENGYDVAMTGKGWGPGIAKDKNGKQRNLAGKPYNSLKLKSPAKGISNVDYAGNFEEFLKDRDKKKPFCFWYGGKEPHRKYEYGSGIKYGGKKLSDIDEVPKYWPDNKIVRTDMLDYGYEVEYFDSHLGRMIKKLEELGELENTLIIVTSDNGMPFPRCKAQEYEDSNHMPFAVMWPKGIKNPGRKIEDYISFIDIAPTFLDVAGVDWSKSGMHSTPGKSLREIFDSEKAGRVVPERDHVLIGKERHDIGRPNDWGYPIRGIIKNDMLYLENFHADRWPAGNPETGYLECDGSPTKTFILNEHRKNPDYSYWHLNFGFHDAVEFFDLNKDPYCMTNLAAAKQDLLMQLKSQMYKKLKLQGDPRMNGNGQIFDTYPVIKGRNFHEGFLNGKYTKKNTGWVNPTDYEEAPTK
ncbi:MAG: sulfatase [Lentisphaeraceae bacterium]|nr:sulfatase [Lentisphaeraceae bacterium]